FGDAFGGGGVVFADEFFDLLDVGDLGDDGVAHERAQVVERAEIFVGGHGDHDGFLGRVVAEGKNLVGGGDLRRDGLDCLFGDFDAFEIDQFIAALGGEGDVEIAFLDVAQVDENSAKRPAFALLEGERFDELIAVDFAHLGEY